METDRTVYLAMAELARRYEAGLGSPIPGPLTRYELRCFSQHGEDGVIAEMLCRVGASNRSFVEFGIETGREGNCVFLADVMGWSGVFIEPAGEPHAALERKYAGNPQVTTVNSAVTPANVQDIFERHRVPPEPDILSIDVDGADYWIWQAIDRYRPRVLVIEYNAALPVDQVLVQPPGHDQPWDGTDCFGASLGAMIDLSGRKGYRFAHTDLSGANAFFVREDLAGERFLPATEAPRRGEPNYFMTGYHHPHNDASREFVDPTTG